MFDLTSDQIEFFDTEGYLVLQNLIPGDLISRLQRASVKMISQSLQSLTINSARKHIAYITKNRTSLITRINNLFLFDLPVFLELLGCTQIVSVARSMIGEDYVSTYESIVIKNKGEDLPIGWHRDMTHNREGRVFTIGIYLDKSFKGKGALNIIPGTQSSPEELCTIEDDLRSGKLNPVEIEMELSDILIHDVMVVHSSLPVIDQDYRRVIYFEFRPITQAKTNQGFSEEWIEYRQQLNKLAQQRWQKIQDRNSNFNQKEWSLEEKELIEKLYSIQAHIEPGHYCFLSK